jgi:SAM-dependent methyltransferase
MQDFKHRDSTEVAFWTERFEQSFTPWDKAGVPVEFQRFVQQAKAPMTTLIPGCGFGHEVGLLADSGWDVTAIDYTPAAVAAAKQYLGRHGDKVVQADFFEYQPSSTLQLIYERAFLCALPPTKRAAIASRWAQLLPPGGLLAGFFFIAETPSGPPFGIVREDLQALLQPNFECIEEQQVEDSIPAFTGNEYWQVWRRKA